MIDLTGAHGSCAPSVGRLVGRGRDRRDLVKSSVRKCHEHPRIIGLEPTHAIRVQDKRKPELNAFVLAVTLKRRNPLAVSTVRRNVVAPILEAKVMKSRKRIVIEAERDQLIKQFQGLLRTHLSPHGHAQRVLADKQV